MDDFSEANEDVLARRIEHMLRSDATDPSVSNSQNLVEVDTNSFVQYAQNEDAVTLMRLWQNKKCLVATKRHTARPNFTEACHVSASKGWPIQVRSTGGTVVSHGPGILNVSVMHRTSVSSIEAGYLPLMNLLKSALAKIGILSVGGCRDRAFCDGKYNLLIDGRKVAGTAARYKRRSRNVWLAHACLWVTCDPAENLEAISRFERQLGETPDYELDAHTTISASIS